MSSRSVTVMKQLRRPWYQNLAPLALGAAVDAVEDEARVGMIIRPNAEDLRRDLGDTVGPICHRGVARMFRADECCISR